MALMEGGPTLLAAPVSSTSGSNTTTNATPLVLANAPVPVGSHILDVYVTATDGGSNGAAWSLRQGVISDGAAVATLIGTTGTLLANVATALLGATVVLTTAGQNLVVTATGVTGKNLSWAWRLNVVI